MKTILIALASAMLILASAAAEQDPVRFTVRGDLARAKTYFGIVTNLDNKEYAAAEAKFKAIPSTNGWGGMLYPITAQHLSNQEYAEARDLCSQEIDFWIIDTAADWQVPALTTLLDNPERLRFLQDLATYRQKFPERTEAGRKSGALVADILRKATERKRKETK
jgi:hypothetical protein